MVKIFRLGYYYVLSVFFLEHFIASFKILKVQHAYAIYIVEKTLCVIVKCIIKSNLSYKEDLVMLIKKVTLKLNYQDMTWELAKNRYK